MEVDKELITKMADDVWYIAKMLEETLNYPYASIELKRISSCLHDIRAGRKTDWYKTHKLMGIEEYECEKNI